MVVESGGCHGYQNKMELTETVNPEDDTYAFVLLVSYSTVSDNQFAPSDLYQFPVISPKYIVLSLTIEYTSATVSAS